MSKSKSIKTSTHRFGKVLPIGYPSFLSELKNRIRSAQIKAAVSVNREMIALYWDIGRRIVQQQDKHAWGTSVIEKLASDLSRSFPGVEGFSERNIWRMRAFYLAYTRRLKLPRAVAELDGVNLPQAVAEIPWGHNIVLLEKLKEPIARLWYAKAVLEYGWSRDILIHQIESKARRRFGNASSNFKKLLPQPQSDLAQQILKDPYNFDFLTLRKKAQERDLEHGLLEHIRKFLVELGLGFCFVGSQHKLTLRNKEYFVDLLFFHRHLRCLVALELKMGDFKPEYAGKMNFYLNLLDDHVRLPNENPSIGIILCKSRDRLEVEYALRGINKPMGVSKYSLARTPPKKLAKELPSPEQLKKELL